MCGKNKILPQSGQTTKTRSAELDVWKFILSIVIVILHSEYLPVKVDQVYFHGGSIFVEFFFIVSGYLMAQSAEKRKNYQNLLQETSTFLRRKISSIYPYLLCAFIPALVIKTAYHGMGVLALVKNACKGIGELLLLKSTGLTGPVFNAPTWYLSAMILSMAVLYPLILRFGDFFKRIVCPLIAFFLLGYLARKYVHFRTPDVWDGMFEKGMIRGFAEVALGVYCYEIGKLISHIQFTKFSKIIFALVEYGGLIAILWYSNTKSCWDMDVPSVLLIAMIVIIICGNHSILAPVWNKLKFTTYLGKMSLMIYINHIYWVWLLAILDVDWSYNKMLMVYVAATFVSAGVCWIVTDCVRKLINKKKDGFRRLFVKA